MTSEMTNKISYFNILEKLAKLSSSFNTLFDKKQKCKLYSLIFYFRRKLFGWRSTKQKAANDDNSETVGNIENCLQQQSKTCAARARAVVAGYRLRYARSASLVPK